MTLGWVGKDFCIPRSEKEFLEQRERWYEMLYAMPESRRGHLIEALKEKLELYENELEAAEEAVMSLTDTIERMYEDLRELEK